MSRILLASLLIATVFDCNCKRPKALIVTAGISRSLLIFYGAVAETLAYNGFEVTQLVMAAIPEARNYVAPEGTEAIVVDVDPDGLFSTVFEADGGKAVYYDNPPMTAFFDFMKNCTMNMLRHKTILDALRVEKFDIGFANMCHFGPTGILEEVGIEATVFLPSGGFLEHFYWHMGVPSPWSYVPSDVSPWTDIMGMKERALNAISHLMHLRSFVGLPDEQKAFRYTYGSQFPDLRKLVSNFQLAMVNGEELLDFPRPTLPKVIYIGGLGMTPVVFKSLSKVWL